MKNIKYVISHNKVYGGNTVTYVTPWGKTSLLAPYGGYVFEKKGKHVDDGDDFIYPLFLNTREEAREYIKKRESFVVIYQVEINDNKQIIKWIKKNP